MAELSVEDVDYKSVKFLVSGLQNPGNTYDKFVFNIIQNGLVVIEYSLEDLGFIDSYTAFYFTFDNPDYLGNNCLSPGCDYEATVDCYFEGIPYTLNSVSFSTDEISPPSGSVLPESYVPVRNQGVFDSCVADCLAGIMEIFKNRCGVTHEQYSTAYIFGSDGNPDLNGMVFKDAVEMCKICGSPRFEVFSGEFPDATWKSEAVAMFDAADAFSIYNAKNQKFQQIQNVDFYDCETVKSYIQDCGAFMFNFRVPENFYNVGINGVVPQPDTYTGINHSMMLIGITNISGKVHWIAQNSWGEEWGDSGRCYIPYDWGCGVQSPVTHSSGESSWTCDSYAVTPGTGFVDANPGRPYDVTAVQESTSLELEVSWQCDSDAELYILLAKEHGSNKWWKKAEVSEKSTLISMDYYDQIYDIAVIAADNYYCSEISETVQVSLESPYPKRFQWTYPKQSGMPYNVHADEWNRLCEKIGAALEYHIGIFPDYNIVFPGDCFEAVMYLDALGKVEELRQACGCEQDYTAIYDFFDECARNGILIPVKSEYFNNIVEQLNDVLF